MTDGSQTRIERVPLGWDAPPVVTAAEWLAERFGSDLDGVLVAQPGARGGRLLRERLARRLGPSWRPPTFLTAGQSSDALLGLQGRAASRTVRTLAWVRALRETPTADLRRVVARPPADDEHGAWLRLAEEVRGLFGEVAAEGLGFDDVARGEGLPIEAQGERARWRALAAAQERMAATLEAHGLVDPHLARLAAIEAGSIASPRAVVLVGVAELTGLLRRALELSRSPVHVLVAAPADRLDGFDELGGLVPSTWIARGTSIALDQWRVATGPDDQAIAACDAIAEQDGRFAAEDLTIGVADAEVAPFLRRRLAGHGVRARDAAGAPLSMTAPMMLLEAAREYLDGRRFRAFAALVRHPDFELRVLRDGACDDPVGVLDAYQQRNLPARGDGPWFEKRGHLVRSIADAVHGCLGALTEDGARPVNAWADEIRALLTTVYGDRVLRDDVEADRALSLALSHLGRALDELESMPSELAFDAPAHAALQLLSRIVSGAAVPAAAAASGEPTIEMLGWLELAQDDAPAVVVTGFNDGKVPESVRGDAFLPDGLRRSLGLVDDERRLARDLYASELLVHSRARCTFVTGRRSLAGDPLVPSRILFHCADDALLGRVERFLTGAPPPVRGAEPDARARELPRMPGGVTVDRMSVTAFKAYLMSPYAFYLQRVLRLDVADDRARELDPLQFGTLAHDALERWGRDEVARDRADAEDIARDMTAALRSVARERFGDDPLPAVALQVEQIAWRLEHFARRQAEWRAEGWRVVEVEWEPEGRCVPFDVDGAPIELSGKVDRIDENERTGRVALIDYKTGEGSAGALRAHRGTDGSWKDLQLPLYTVLARGPIAGRPVSLGYANLAKDEAGIRFDVHEDFSPNKKEPESMAESLDSAIECAREVVRRVRDGEFFELGDYRLREPAWVALGGTALVASVASGGDDAEEVDA